MPDWFYISIVWRLYSLNISRMPVTLLCDWSALLHMYHYTVIQLGHSTESTYAKTHKLQEGGMNIGFWVFDLSCLQIYFCFAIGAECSVADSCCSVCFVIVPATMT
jgi:hypothetical protein